MDGDNRNDRLSNLIWESHIDNEKRKVAHGTINRGARNGGAKLTRDQIRQIRKEYKTGLISQKALGYKFNISQPQIFNIVNNKHWIENEIKI